MLRFVAGGSGACLYDANDGGTCHVAAGYWLYMWLYWHVASLSRIYWHGYVSKHLSTLGAQPSIWSPGSMCYMQYRSTHKPQPGICDIIPVWVRSYARI